MAIAAVTFVLNQDILRELAESLSGASETLRIFIGIFEFLAQQESSLAYLWNFNPPDLAPWQWLNIAGATITGLLFLSSDRVRAQWQFAWFLWMARLRNLCATFYIFMAFGYVVLAPRGLGDVTPTGWLAPLDALYGPYLER